MQSEDVRNMKSNTMFTTSRSPELNELKEIVFRRIRSRAVVGEDLDQEGASVPRVAQIPP